MKNKFLVTFAFLYCFFDCQSQEKRALLIGIDQYAPPPGYKPSTTFGRNEFPNLLGPRNDVLSIQSILFSKFDFQDIDTLIGANASRDNILKGINDLLIKSNFGDVALIYFAGHGSQVYNSFSEENDKLDETIVPYDAWKEGVEDIRDKELGKLFNRFIDKGVKLTSIFDCCHSGSLSRGFAPQKASYRFMRGANYDSKDSSRFVAPENREGNNFLMLTATKENEPAEEQKDDHDIYHGAFTIALTEALNQLPVNSSAQPFYECLRAILKSNGKNQEPLIIGKSERIQQTLFGLGHGILLDKTQVAISGIFKSSNVVFLQGGIALDINKGNEFAKIVGGDTAVIARIDSVLGISSSRAHIISGDIGQLKKGEFLELTNWVYSQQTLIKIYVPQNPFTYEQVLHFAQIDEQLKASKEIKWINDLERNDPFASVYFDAGTWFMNDIKTGRILLKENSPKEIIQNAKKDSTLYFELPLCNELVKAIKQKFQENKNILVVDDPSIAYYTIYGTIDDSGMPCYGLRRSQTSSRDSLESMPVQTKSFNLSGNDQSAFQFIADSIYDYALRLSKVRGWLLLSPPLGKKNEFPFHLEFFDTKENKLLNGEYKVNELVNLHLVADSDYVQTSNKYVYVFGIDKYGNMESFYPKDGDGNQKNQFPQYSLAGNRNSVVKDVQLIEPFRVPLPSGTDKYFLLATEDPIQFSSELFHQQGVRGIQTSSPFQELLNIGNETSRGISSIPKTWDLKKIAIKCVY